MELNVFIEVIESSDEFEIVESNKELNRIYMATDEIAAVIVNNFILNPSKIEISGQSIHFWINPSLKGWNLDNDIILGSFFDVKDINSFEIN